MENNNFKILNKSSTLVSPIITGVTFSSCHRVFITFIKNYLIHNPNWLKNGINIFLCLKTWQFVPNFQ